jgi:hypothetical protein
MAQSYKSGSRDHRSHSRPDRPLPVDGGSAPPGDNAHDVTKESGCYGSLACAWPLGPTRSPGQHGTVCRFSSLDAPGLRSLWSPTFWPQDNEDLKAAARAESPVQEVHFVVTVYVRYNYDWRASVHGCLHVWILDEDFVARSEVEPLFIPRHRTGLTQSI